jgi:hypothetical protein
MRRPRRADRALVRADRPSFSRSHEVEVIYAIHYVDPRHPPLAGVTLASDASQIPALKARLEHDGYVVTEVTPKTPIVRRST